MLYHMQQIVVRLFYFAFIVNDSTFVFIFNLVNAQLLGGIECRILDREKLGLESPLHRTVPLMATRCSDNKTKSINYDLFIFAS